MLLSVVRELQTRDRSLITAQWFTGFRIPNASKDAKGGTGPARAGHDN